ncbi:hypothetical protein [Curtobacterium aurantiacum]|uniref:Exo-alpha-sialidase n=1 Tax=Curtobacterium aurantiacum TaxID=3236919 RepID=A0ABS5VEJ5_9MICO|nr:hypothetical protein [Curtobacterium flaccumfaciens]MBT1544301.1 hypothetical protein [Curtobacterium flaccumfaciens pv. flaccumfaciens]MBT1587120.1 hypothetical protein [Curtobacterium flaccumfaciens pv. flaccumfaciens]
MKNRRGTRSLGRALPRTTFILVAVVVVALIVIDVVLVALALGRTAPEENGPAGPIPTFTRTPDPSETPRAGASADADAAATKQQGRRLLAAVDGQEAWRASGGSCAGPRPVLEHTVDGGATWVPVGLGTDVGSLMAIRASSAELSILAGVGDDCTTTARTSTDAGVTWKAGNAGAAGAGITTDGVVLASGTVQAPCSDPIEAFQGEQTSVVICDGQLEWRTGTDAWVDVPMGGVRSIAVDGGEYTLARVGVSSCDGVQLVTMSAAGVTPTTPVTPVGCADGTDTDGTVTIDRAGQDVWLWDGETVRVSSDGGASW